VFESGKCLAQGRSAYTELLGEMHLIDAVALGQPAVDDHVPQLGYY
jgi:hypothetical protein